MLLVLYVVQVAFLGMAKLGMAKDFVSQYFTE